MPRFRPSLERLERRDVPSAAVPSTTNLTAGVLTVLGSQQADVITLHSVNNNTAIRVTDGTRIVGQFATAAVGRIVVSGDFGNDRITISPALTKPTYLYGGVGDDVILGGNGPDQIYGSSGNDNLQGRGGNDVIWGGSGNDTITDAGVNTLVQGSPNRTVAPSVIERDIVTRVNLERTSRGLPALTINLQLTWAARTHSQQQATRHNMAHLLYGVNAPHPENRLDLAGYDAWRTYGENVAYGYTTAAAVMAGWMGSTGHRENILNPSFREIGVGMVVDSLGVIYWTQVFGAR